MLWLALRILTGDLAKYLGMIFGISFASLLIAQQASIFCGLMSFTASQINDIRGASLWVMDENVRFIDDVKPMSENELLRVRGVSGVHWAVRLYKGLARARLDDGKFQQVILIGLDDQAPVGAPLEILKGNLDDLSMPDAVIMDERGARQLWPEDPYKLGRVFEMNDRRAVLVGICTASRTFQTFPIVYTRYSRALAFSPPERKMLSFILAEPKPGLTPEEVALEIRERTGLAALTQDEFRWKTISFYLNETGIPVNFGITVLLGLIVGTAITGQTFYLFTVENLKQFGALKAMGASDWQIVGMILVQAALVSFIGYGLGVGGAALFGELTRNASKLAFFMPWQVLVGTGVAVFLMAIASSLLCIVRVLVLEPAVVFRG